MMCSYCDKPVFYRRRYSGENLCKKHFIKSIEGKVRKNISRYLGKYKRIGLAVSGGKDSLVMAYIVNNLVKPGGPHIYGLIVDEGISGYRDKSIEFAKQLLDDLKIPYVIGAMKEYLYVNIDDVMEIADSPLPCTFCGVFRRRVLEILGRKNKIEVIFTGHNASDISETILLNVLQGNIKHLIMQMEPNNGFIPRIYPLHNLIEQEIVLYAYLRKINYYDNPCPYARYALRSEVRNFLSDMEWRHPGITFNILRLGEKLKIEYGRQLKLKACSKCGYPTSSKICKTCELLETLDKLKKLNIR
jgi:uncharacterized protein (TIGR00269 family)